MGLVTGTYKLANAFHTSSPLAIVAAGLLIGNPWRAQRNSCLTHLKQHGEGTFLTARQAMP